MKKLFLLFIVLFTGVTRLWATVSFVEGRPYTIKNSSGRYVNIETAGQNAKLSATCSVVYFTASGDNWTISNLTNSLYATSWNATANTSNSTPWIIAEVSGKDNTYTLNQQTSTCTGYLGFDSDAEGSKMYCNKNATEFVIEELDNAPTIPLAHQIRVGEKANSFTFASSASDNDHWYLITNRRKQNAGQQTDEAYNTPVYFAGAGNTLKRADTNINPAAITGNPVSTYIKHFVRFVRVGEGKYNLQFANGAFVNASLQGTCLQSEAGTYLFYNTTTEGTGFGWNLDDDSKKIVDNNGQGAALAFWGSGTVTATSGNNVWSIYPVEFVSTVEISYTLTDENGATYNGTYNAKWDGDDTAEPSIPGAYGATFSNKVFSNTSGYSLTADITFEFPVSSNSIDNPTAIRSALGNSLWYAKDDKVIADNEANTTVYNVYADNYRWNIIPVFSEGTFTFKLYNVGADKYIPSNPSTDAKTATTLTADGASAGAFLYSHYSQGNGFFDEATSKFLTINTSGTAQNVWLWGGWSSTTHQGSVMSFPDLDIVSVSEAFAALKGTTKFDILEGSTVMGPGEFAAPASINAAIDAAQDVEDNDEAKFAFIESDNGKMIKNYLNQVKKYGQPVSVKITMNKEYGTMILPAGCTRVTGLDIYSVNETVGNTLTLTPVEGNYIAKTPYIIHAEEESKYTLVCWNTNSGTHTSGWLTGVLNSETDIPSGSYMLATNKSTGVQAFYKVSGSGVKCAINKCYLTVPNETQARTLYLDIDGEITAIEEVFGDETEQGAIYNLAGQRLTKAQKGINIINGKKIIK